MTTQEKKEHVEYLEATDMLRDGKYISANVTITGVIQPGTVKNSVGQVIDKYIITIKESPKHVIINKTNARLIRLECGSTKSEGWIGKKITLYPAMVRFGGEDTPGIRVRLSGNKTAPMSCKKFMGKDLTLA